MTDIDAALAQLRTLPLHPGLAAMDQAVLKEVVLGPRRAEAISPSTMGLAALASLAIGLASSTFAPANAAPPMPFGTPAALAPSTLLGLGE